MSSDSEAALVRGSPARSTVARQCRDFYVRRLERTATMQKRWSLCEAEPGAPRAPAPDVPPPEQEHPLRKCRSTLDVAMDSLRREISSLIAQDNDLFRQLLSLHDSIAELRERQQSCYSLYQDEEEEEEEEEGEEEEDRADSPSLESLSDNGDLPQTSPESTLSCRSSSLSSDSAHYRHPRRAVATCKKRHRAATVASDQPRPLVFVDKSEICFRCRKMAPPYRRSRSTANFYWCSEDMDSYDSGIHLQGSHSDSDHEIFV